jgi:hypothetical protein
MHNKLQRLLLVISWFLWKTVEFDCLGAAARTFSDGTWEGIHKVGANENNNEKKCRNSTLLHLQAGGIAAGGRLA